MTYVLVRVGLKPETHQTQPVRDALDDISKTQRFATGLTRTFSKTTVTKRLF